MSRAKMLDIDPKKVEYAILKNGESIRTAAEKIGVTPGLIRSGLTKKRMSHRTVLALCGICGVKEDDFFPDKPETIEKREADHQQSEDIMALSQKLDFINRNICEMNDLITEQNNLFRMLIRLLN